MLNILGNSNSVLNQFIGEIRDVSVQLDKMRFRENLKRIGMVFAYEISKTLDYEQREVETPLGVSAVSMPRHYPVLATILRAGLPLHQGLLSFFDQSENAFISAYRKHHKDGSFDIHLEYTSSPILDNKVLVISDAMLATGASMLLAYKELLKNGKPDHVHIVTILSSVDGINYLKRNLPSKDITIWTGAVDEELTAQAYIVPGLGDAGDLAYGSKEQPF